MYKTGTLHIYAVECELVKPGGDVFIHIQLGSKKTRTNVQKDLTWNMDCVMDVSDHNGEELSLIIKNWVRIGKNVKIASVNIPLSAFEDEKFHDAWFPLSTPTDDEKGGRIRLVARYTSAVRKNMLFSIASSHCDVLKAILMEPGSIVVCALSDMCKDQDLAIALIRIFNSNHSALPLLQNLLDRDIKKFRANPKADFLTLFRSDCASTRMMREYFHLISRWNYLRKLVRPLVEEICTQVKNGNSFEIDPQKLKPEENLTANRARLTALAEKFVKQIALSGGDLPENMRRLFHVLKTTLEDDCNVYSLVPLSNIFFLRFLCPAIMIPSVAGITHKKLDPDASRGLLYVAKIVQNIASNCKFHEAFMSDFNGLVDRYSPHFSAFLRMLSDPRGGVADDPRQQYTNEDVIKLLSVVVHKMHTNYDSLCDVLCKDPSFAINGQIHETPFFKLGILFAEQG